MAFGRRHVFVTSPRDITITATVYNIGDTLNYNSNIWTSMTNRPKIRTEAGLGLSTRTPEAYIIIIPHINIYKDVVVLR